MFTRRNLSGVNLPDHDVLFQNLATEFRTITKHIAIVQSRDSGNVKTLIEETVFQLINEQTQVSEISMNEDKKLK